MSSPLAASLVLLAGLVLAAAAGVRADRFFEGSDRVYHKRRDQTLEPIVEPHIYRDRVQRASAKGHHFAAAENPDRADSGFGRAPRACRRGRIDRAACAGASAKS